MELKQLVANLWADMHNQNWDNLSEYFSGDAVIRFHDTNEQLDRDEFVSLNAQFPGGWSIEVERLIQAEDTVISVVKVTPRDDPDSKLDSYYTTSFFEFGDGKIIKLDEYWCICGAPPEEWREGTQIGKPIR